MTNLTYTVEPPTHRGPQSHPSYSFYRVVENDGSPVAYVPDEVTARIIAECLSDPIAFRARRTF